MKNLSLIASLFVIAGTAFAKSNSDCYEKLLKNLTQDSASYHVAADFPESMSSEDQARALIKRTLKKARCTTDAKIEKITCRNIVPEEGHTQVCYVEADVGYFFTTKDYIDTANVVFNRWD